MIVAVTTGIVTVDDDAADAAVDAADAGAMAGVAIDAVAVSICDIGAKLWRRCYFFETMSSIELNELLCEMDFVHWIHLRDIHAAAIAVALLPCLNTGHVWV